MDWSKEYVILTGGAGFLGQHVSNALCIAGVGSMTIPRSADYDLRFGPEVERLFHNNPGATLVIHLAANVGGIGYNQRHSAQLFYDNLLMGLYTLHEAWRAGVPKFVGIGTVCAYPKYAPTPFKESDLWNGYPEETNAPYGIAKRMLLAQSLSYRAQYGYNAIHLLLANLYGPGDHTGERAHVIPDVIRKMVSAKQRGEPSVTLWGDGTPTREFLYVTDAARAIVLAAERYSRPEPVNVGVGIETSIAQAAALIAQEVGYTGNILWDTTKPNGQARRCLDVSRAQSEFGFTAQVPFTEGIRHTVKWYVEEHEHALYHR